MLLYYKICPFWTCVFCFTKIAISREDINVSLVGNGNCKTMLLLLRNFWFIRFLGVLSNLLPLKDSEVVLFNFTTRKPHCWLAFHTADLGLRSKTQFFMCLSSKKMVAFQASLSYSSPHVGLLMVQEQYLLCGVSDEGLAGIAVLVSCFVNSLLINMKWYLSFNDS